MAVYEYDDKRLEHLREAAKRHLWMHFTRMSTFEEEDLPIMVRGEGAYVWDASGKRYLDGLSGLFVSQLGHGRTELAEAASKQASTLAYFPVWSYAHTPAVELAEKLASLAPGDLNRVFFTTGGGEAVEAAYKLARQYFAARGKHHKYKVISRNIAYHGASLGALAITGLPAYKEPFEPLLPGARKVANTNEYRCKDCAWKGSCTLRCADDIERVIQYEGADTVALVYLEPVQNGGGCFTPPPGYFERVREICDEYDVLLVSDEVITAFGRLGHYFGAERYGYMPDMITCAKGMTSGYAPIGAMIASDRLMEPFLHGKNTYLHGITYGGHPVAAAVALANLEVFEREQINDHVLANEELFRSKLESLKDIPIVGEVRGAGYFYALELVKDQETKGLFSDEESEHLLRGFLSRELLDKGLICRSDDRGEPVVQLAPPLICTAEQFDEIIEILRPVLERAAEMIVS
ncbi:aspartate aminotransferase family protein [Ferrithrix thermotolerans]|uniref:aspartate aminotransferase family protein n=1 Tax=Ferrithrix thermotolerans TaxID=209649 RepID=UPI00093309DC|nr:aspartate aminotransferase family protein [Ferrithrix thermotolerans]